MADPEIYSESFIPTVRTQSKYCPLALELIQAADILDEDQSHPASQRIIPDIHLSGSLAGWLVYKAGVLDEEFKLWENEGKDTATEVCEKKYSHALAVAREVNSKIDDDGKLKV